MNSIAQTAPERGSRDRPLELRALLKALVAEGMITKDQPASLLARLGGNGLDKRHPLAAIADMGWANARDPQRKLTLDALTAWVAKAADLPFYRIDPLSIELEKVTGIVSYAYAARLGVLPVKVTPAEVTIATAEPYVQAWVRELEPIIKRKVQRVMANPKDIQRYLLEFYALARSIKASAAERERSPIGNAQNLEQLMELGRAGKLDANDQHIVSIVDWLLQYAFDQRASDIHLEPRRDVGNMRFRIDGVLHDVYQIPATVMMAVTSRIKILARMDIGERRRPQDGRIKTRNPQGREIELRVSSLPTAFGEKLVLRIFDPEVLMKDFAALGFSAADVTRWDQLIREPNGIILVTGPTGSGKTTTLYSTLKSLAGPEVNVCTIEDPIELVAAEFNQTQVQPQIDLTFASGVRALMRQDPDIIMIGEIRDLETAEVAVQAALTGHLVLSTLHTNDAPSAITRLLDLDAPAYLLRATLLGVLAQRLLRKLCPYCRKAIPVAEVGWHELIGSWKIEQPAEIYEPGGCLECRETGYLGRVGIYEFMTVSPTVKTMIREDLDLAKLRYVAMREGMTPLRVAGLRKVAEGVTTIDEVLGATPDPLRD